MNRPDDVLKYFVIMRVQYVRFTVAYMYNGAA